MLENFDVNSSKMTKNTFINSKLTFISIEKRCSTKLAMGPSLLTNPLNFLLIKIKPGHIKRGAIILCSLLKDQGRDCYYRTSINWTRHSTEQSVWEPKGLNTWRISARTEISSPVFETGLETGSGKRAEKPHVIAFSISARAESELADPCAVVVFNERKWRPR